MPRTRRRRLKFQFDIFRKLRVQFLQLWKRRELTPLRMELLLNILWLMLALPAVLIWRRQSACVRSSGKQSRSRSFVLLGCLLALLFPVVSASDDLHPISAEIEESGPFKRTVKQSPGVKSPMCGYDGGGVARPAHVALYRPENEAFGAVSEYLFVLPRQTLVSTIDDRAPPQA